MFLSPLRKLFTKEGKPVDILDLNKDAPLLDLAKVAPALKTLRAKLTWGMHPVHGASLDKGFDLDVFNYVLSASEKIGGGQDVCFFNNKTYANGAIVLPEDQRVGGTEWADYTLDRVPADRRHIDVYVFIHDAAERGQHFGMMSGAKLELIADGQQVVQAYSIAEFTGKTCLHAGRLTHAGSGWTFQPIGEAAVADPNAVARAYL